MKKYPQFWKKEGSVLVRTFTFENFVDAVSFVDKIVPVAEELNHHPDIEIFSYNKVTIKLTTHDAGSTITDLDCTLAQQINELFL